MSDVLRRWGRYDVPMARRSKNTARPAQGNNFNRPLVKRVFQRPRRDGKVIAPAVPPGNRG